MQHSIKHTRSFFSTIFLLGILFINSSFMHPFYVSITSIDYKNNTKSLEIAARLFHDDLELELNKARKEKFDILKTYHDGRIDSAISQYFQKHLKIQVNKKGSKLQYIGYEIDKEVAWCYFEVQQATPPQQIALFCDILYPSFKTQSNIFHVTVNNKRQSAKLDHPKTSATLTFSP